MSLVALIAFIDVLCGAAMVGTASYVEAVRASGRTLGRVGIDGFEFEAEVGGDGEV